RLIRRTPRSPPLIRRTCALRFSPSSRSSQPQDSNGLGDFLAFALDDLQLLLEADVVPDLEASAGVEDAHVLLEPGVLAQMRRNQDAALCIERGVLCSGHHHAAELLEAGIQLGQALDPTLQLEPTFGRVERQGPHIEDPRDHRRPTIQSHELHSHPRWNRQAALGLEPIRRFALALAHRSPPPCRTVGGIPTDPHESPRGLYSMGTTRSFKGNLAI